MKKIILFSVLLFNGIFTIGQQNPKTCGHTLVTKELWSKNPQLEENYRQMVKNLIKSNHVGNKDNTVIIPLVFHVIHEYGSENITDAQIFDQVEILNEDYRKLNSDVNLVIPEFESRVADCNIEFRLATKDYNGNCTNGIEHIYSHETNIGDDFSKIHQWDRNKYLNIWVVSSMRPGVAGYAYYPSDIDNANFYVDGVIILNDYIGSIGTGSTHNSRALTHEIGHYLGLSHPWGSTNDPGVACGDDFIEDTPITKGFDFCPTNTDQAKVCDPNIIENYQNYMDYSYCSKMFTLDQSTLMNNILTSAEAYRDILVSEQNLIETGVDLNPICKPVADFSSNENFACVGDVITFKDFSWNAVVNNRTWYFEGGTPQTSTTANPSVTFNSKGWKKVKLIVENASGIDSMVVNKYIYISDANADVFGPNLENFNSNNTNWLVNNPENNEAKWEYSSNNGISNSGCYKIHNYYETPSGVISDYEYFYNSRLGGNKDALISPSFDLSSTGAVDLSFDYAYATKGINSEQITEKLNIYVSKNCGKLWNLKKTISGAELLTAGNNTTDFIPTNNNQWKHYSLSFPAINATDTKTRFKFEFVSSDYSNNLYIDNINLSGMLGIKENPLNSINLNIYPNPVGNNESLNISYFANDQKIEFELMNVNNQIIKSKIITTTNQYVSFNLLENLTISSGLYFVKIKQGDYYKIEKIIIE